MNRNRIWTVVIGLLIGVGLSVVAFFVFVAIALQSWGSNK